MTNLETTLKTLDGFVDNEYLDKYIRLVERHKHSPVYRGDVNLHHIVPKAWFKLNNRDVDNDPSNLVTLRYREHVLAHYFLCLCTDGKLKYANELALICLLSRKKLGSQNRQLIENLPLYNSIYEDYKQKQKENYKLY